MLELKYSKQHSFFRILLFYFIIIQWHFINLEWVMFENQKLYWFTSFHPAGFWVTLVPRWVYCFFNSGSRFVCLILFIKCSINHLIQHWVIIILIKIRGVCFSKIYFFPANHLFLCFFNWFNDWCFLSSIHIREFCQIIRYGSFNSFMTNSQRNIFHISKECIPRID